MTMRAKTTGLLATGTAVLLLASGAAAQAPDHLKCYKIKDPVAKVSYTANLTGLAPENGCTIKAPARMLCVQSTKTAISPTPPPSGAPSGTPAGVFACYKVKCQKGALPGVAVTDQFGSRTVTPSAAKFLCAPAAIPTTTTTTSVTLPATSLPPTTTSLP